MQEMLTLTTRMNALARITLGNVNIAATTALQVGAMHLFSSSNLFFAKPKIKLPPMPQAIDAVGREIALRRGANILMPILTPTKYREHYTLYEGEPGMRPACLASGHLLFLLSLTKAPVLPVGPAACMATCPS